MNFFSSILKHLKYSLKKVTYFLSELISYLVIAFLKVHRDLSRKTSGLYIYPHFNACSIRLRLPATVFKVLFGFFLVSLVCLSALNTANIILGFFEIKTNYTYQQNQEIVKNYQILLKQYLTGHGQKENRIKNSVAILFGKKSTLTGVGGSQENDQKNLKLMEDYLSKPGLPENLDEAFSDIPDEDYLKYVDEHLVNFDNTLNMIDKFEIRLNQQKKVTKSIPTAWPIRNLISLQNMQNSAEANSDDSLTSSTKAEIKSTLEENHQNIALSEESATDLESVLSAVTDEKSSESIVLDINKPMAVVATSRGIVENIVQKGNTWSVKVQHEFGFSTYYEGIEELSVKKDDLINRLGEIGKVGLLTAKKTSSTKGDYYPKLKYQIKIARTFVNPRDFLIFNY